MVVNFQAHPRSRGENDSHAPSSHEDSGSSPLTRGKRKLLSSRSSHPRLIPAHAGKTCSLPRSHRRVRAHPRSRGENAVKALVNQRLEGSSPLTRGKQPVRLDQVAPQRLIPAHAGKTFKHCGVPSGLRAHPRSRGENTFSRKLNGRSDGSSPLTRGKQDGPNYIAGRLRLIPAHAGKTCDKRMRGQDGAGSSPLTRGKLSAVWVVISVFRLIPAHAGKTTGRRSSAASHPAHPRSREENIDAWQLPERHVGSSPLTRGKRTLRVTAGILRRLIPAHAGKTVQAENPNSQHRAHPRSRGENRPGGKPQLSTQGSSPLTRGKRSHHGGYDKRRGLIPAHAGKTSRRTARLCVGRAHPRSRGENSAVRASDAASGGSSPLTRGKRPLPSREEAGGRLIPAHAGKTSASPEPSRSSPAHPRSRGEN